LIHRLDRDAAGLLVFSKTDRAYRSLKTQFFKHTVLRQYTAVTEGIPSPRRGRIESRLVERADGTVRSTTRPGHGQRAISEYEVVSDHGGRSIVSVTLHTGRKHQIRVHLASRGAPIVGDAVYGGAEKGKTPLMLAATTLAFDHPGTGKRVTFKLPPPPFLAMAR
jgi:23S rRNA pseudouridine1911/1915/1917 synthase